MIMSLCGHDNGIVDTEVLLGFMAPHAFRLCHSELPACGTLRETRRLVPMEIGSLCRRVRTGIYVWQWRKPPRTLHRGAWMSAVVRQTAKHSTRSMGVSGTQYIRKDVPRGVNGYGSGSFQPAHYQLLLWPSRGTPR